jgi:hypothetical protein
MLRRAAAIAADQKLLSVLAATSGATTVASTGSDAASILSNLTTALQGMTIGADSKLWLITSPKMYKALGLLPTTGSWLMTNDRIGSSINVAPSDAATTTAYLVDARQIAVDFETAAVDASDAGTAMLDDNPTSTGYQLVSLFSANLVLVKAELWFACLGLRGSGICTITGYT